MRWRNKLLLIAGGLLAAIAVRPAPTQATEYFANQQGSIAARVSTQNTFHHNNASSIDWVQWRNEVRFDLTYDLIKQGSGVTWGPIKHLKFNLLWRGRMDPVFLLRDSYKDRDYDRGNFEFPEGRKPRELFFDIGFDGALRHLSMRIGRQQVVWGEADLFRSLDVVNPLDLTQSGFVGEDFADFRQPLWIAKFMYDLGDIASFWNEAGVEAFFSPNSRPQVNQDNLLVQQTYKISTVQSVPRLAGIQNTGFSRPVAVKFRQVRHPWEFLRVGAQYNDSPAVVENPDGSESDFMYMIRNDVSTSELSTSAIMAGVRLLGTTFGNAYFTLNYLFKRGDFSTSEVQFAQIYDEATPGTSAVRGDVLGRALSMAGTADLNGNGIPDGQEEQIANCMRNRYWNGANSPNRAGELILDPHLVQPNFPGYFQGSVYSPPGQPALRTGISSPANNLPGLPGGQLPQNNASYYTTGMDGVPGSVFGDGLVHASACLDIPVQHAWTHIFGGTLTYNDYDYTGLVFRMEQSLQTKQGRQDSPASSRRLIDMQKKIQYDANGQPIPSTLPCTPANPCGPTARDFETRANRYTQVWRSMVGFDYLRAVAPEFGRKCQNSLLRSLLTDQWFFTFQFLNTYDAHADNVNSPASFTNRFEHWNPFFTLSGTGFFMSQRLRPTWAFALDANYMYPLWYTQIAYFLTPKLEMRIGEVLYLGSHKSEDAGGLFYYSDRDNFYVRLTYYLA